MQTHFEWWVKSILTFVNKVKMLGFKVRNNLRNAFLSLTNDEHKNRKSLTLLSHSLFPFPIWIFAPKFLDTLSRIQFFVFLQCMSLKPEKNSFTFQNGLQTTTFFFFSIFLRANCEYHETKKRFFLKLIWTPEFCCTKKWACVQLLMAEQSDEILHVNITNFSRKLLNFCIIEWRWWVDKLDSLADSVSNIKKSQDLEEVFKLNDILFTVHMTT